MVRNIAYMSPWECREAFDNAVVTIQMMQMVADAYDEAREIWEENKDVERQEDDDPGLYGPNEAQLDVEKWLTYARLVSKREIPAVVEAIADPGSQPQPPILAPSRWHKYLKFFFFTRRKVDFNSGNTLLTSATTSASGTITRAANTSNPTTITPSFSKKSLGSLLRRSKISGPLVIPPLPTVKEEVDIQPKPATRSTPCGCNSRRRRFEYKTHLGRLPRRISWNKSHDLSPGSPPKTLRRIVRRLPVLEAYPFTVADGLVTSRSMKSAAFEHPSSYPWPSSCDKPTIMPLGVSKLTIKSEIEAHEVRSLRSRLVSSLWVLPFQILLFFFFLFFFTAFVVIGLYFVAGGSPSNDGDDSD